MTRHIITQALIAASAFTVLAAAPSAMAASAKPFSAKAKAVKAKTVKAKKLQSTIKVANNTRGRINNRNLNNSRGLQSRNSIRGNRSSLRGSNLNQRGGLRNLRSNRSLRGSALRTSSVFGGRRGFHTPYRSRLGISFHLGTLGFSQYRWSKSPFSLYQPSYGSYGFYQASTICHRVTLQGWHRGHRVPISVKQCSNPWDGSYIIQGSERLLTTRW